MSLCAGAWARNRRASFYAASEGITIMVAGYHLVWTIYGVWLPNDPRGSGSTEVRQPYLRELGELHHGRKRIQPGGAVIRRFYDAASTKLKHETVAFDEPEIQSVADAFAEVIQAKRYTCYACAIMPDHVHLLIRKHRDSAEEMIGNLQELSWEHLQGTGRRSSDHPIWGGPGWKVYLETLEDMERTIRYIRKNPIKDGLPEQMWKFVTAYDGWLPGGRMK